MTLLCSCGHQNCCFSAQPSMMSPTRYSRSQSLCLRKAASKAALHADVPRCTSEIHSDGRIVVIADIADLKMYNSGIDLPLRVTRIGGGPNGETVVFDIAKPEAGKKNGFGSVEMFDGHRAGAEQDFYGEIVNEKGY